MQEQEDILEPQIVSDVVESAKTAKVTRKAKAPAKKTRGGKKSELDKLTVETTDLTTEIPTSADMPRILITRDSGIGSKNSTKLQKEIDELKSMLADKEKQILSLNQKLVQKKEQKQSNDSKLTVSGTINKQQVPEKKLLIKF